MVQLRLAAALLTMPLALGRCPLHGAPNDVDAPRFDPEIVGVIAARVPADEPPADQFVLEDGREVVLTPEVRRIGYTMADEGHLLLVGNAPERPWAYAASPASSPRWPDCYMVFADAVAMRDDGMVEARISIGHPEVPEPAFLVFEPVDGLRAEDVERRSRTRNITLCIDSEGRAVASEEFGIY